jgi:hypothetical protein
MQAACGRPGKSSKEDSSRRELIEVVDAHPLFQLRKFRHHLLKTVAGFSASRIMSGWREVSV